MVDEGRKFLEDQAKEALERFEAALQDMRNAWTKLGDARLNAKAFQTVLVSYTKNSRKPHTPVHLPNFKITQQINVEVNDQSKALDSVSFEVTNVEKDTSRRGQIDTSNRTKVGVLRMIMREAGKALSMSEIVERIPPGSSVGLVRDDLYRIMPRLIKRGEVEKLERGLHRYVEPAKDEPGLFSE